MGKLTPSKKHVLHAYLARTDLKHDILFQVLAMKYKWLSIFRNPISDVVIWDLCAGDAEGRSSPDILDQFQKKVKDLRIQTHTFLVERDVEVFSRLKMNTARKGIHAELYNMDARQFSSLAVADKATSAMFVNADPNLVKDFPVVGDSLKDVPIFTTIVATLGCNVHGVKRSNILLREKWFEPIWSLVRWAPRWYDVKLITPIGDKDQWAHMIIGPLGWYDDESLREGCTSWKHGVDIHSLREDVNGFVKKMETLCYTKKELFIKQLVDSSKKPTDIVCPITGQTNPSVGPEGGDNDE